MPPTMPCLRYLPARKRPGAARAVGMDAPAPAPASVTWRVYAGSRPAYGFPMPASVRMARPGVAAVQALVILSVDGLVDEQTPNHPHNGPPGAGIPPLCRRYAGRSM